MNLVNPVYNYGMNMVKDRATMRRVMMDELSNLLFKRDRKKHWDRVYKKSSPTDLGWYQVHPEMSMKLIARTGIPDSFNT